MRRILARLMGADPRECEQARSTFSEYLDGELGAGDAQRLEAHVGVCPRCRQALTNLRVTLAGLGRLGQGNSADEAAVERARDAWRASSE